MQDLARTLSDYDLELLRVIANRWDVDLNTRDARQAAEYLASMMLKPEKVADAWSRLNDEQRGAMQTLLGAGGRMATAVFTRLFGEIRPMGPGRMEREKPYLNPVSLAEALFYRGMIAATFGEGAKGSNQAFTFVPVDLIRLMPVHKTGYDLSAPPEHVEAVPQPKNIRPSDTILVDDLTTLLVYCQLNDVKLVGGTVEPDHQKTLKPHLLGSNSPARLALMVAIATGLEIVAENDGVFKPVASARKWLDASRSMQVQSMAEAWRDSVTYNELWYTPGLKPENTGWQNDPLLARQTVLTFLELVPASDWWPIDTFISAVKEDEPDFQRPGGDYDSWYIRDAQSGKYLRGFDSWDRVDGAMLRFILTGPMHGLGLLDTAEGGTAARLTAYGRAFMGVADWPNTEKEESITIAPDGLCTVPRGVSRFNRFQLARFTDWEKAADPYEYRLTAAGLAQAARQNIQASNILTFLKRATQDNIPQSVLTLIDTWGQAGADSAAISQMTVLRVPTPELLAAIQATPALRRYLGATLGPTAVAVRAGQWQDLAAALQANGILVDVDMADA
ncbi:MAG: helicase-associated domain-containing protein [Anaerolineae bacterium]|nr:helicase-associated domain-containing protein [Anaerolineae bacterium]